VGSAVARSADDEYAALLFPISAKPFKLSGLSSASLSYPMKTVFEKSETVRRDWLVVDAAGKTLGRLATGIAMRLRGKHKASYTPHVDCGDNIIVLNAEKIHVTGAKLTDKIYYHHTGAIGGIKSVPLNKMLAEHPERAIEIAVKGMLPKGPLGRKIFKKLHVFAGGTHPHAAQQPTAIEIA